MSIDDVLSGKAQFAVVCGDATAVMKTIPDGCANVTYTDPPYGLSAQSTENIVECLTTWLAGGVYTHKAKGFMSADWDSFTPGPEAWREVHRCLRPGGYCVAFSSTRTVDLLGIAVRLAGFEMREGWGWITGCLSEDTEILVDGKWCHYLDATPSSLALCYDAAHDTFSWQAIQESFVYDHDDTAYRVHSDHTDQLVTRNHRCLVERGGAFVFSTAAELAEEDGSRVPVLEDVQTLLAALPVRDEGSRQQNADVQQTMLGRRDSRGQHGTNETHRGEGDCHRSVCDVRNSDAAPEESCGPNEGGVLLDEVQWDAAHRHATAALGEGARGVVGCRGSVAQSEDDRSKQPRMEGRRDTSESAWEPRRSEVCPLPDGVSVDGTEGRLRHGASPGGCAGDWSLPDADGGRPPHEPRFDGQSCGELGSIQDEPGPQTVRASRFTRADLVRFSPVHYRGVVWCVRVPTGAFVARRNGKVFVTGNSGFPKSLDVSKAIDAADSCGTGRPEDIRRLRMGDDYAPTGRPRSGEALSGALLGSNTTKASAVSPAAAQWSGYGTTTKPAFEPLIVARKALDGTVAANVQKHGCGALNIDGARIDHSTVNGGNLADNPHLRGSKERRAGRTTGFGREGDVTQLTAPSGRFPAALALVHDEGCVCEGTREVLTATIVAVDRSTTDNPSVSAYNDGLTGSKAGPRVTETVDAWRCTDTCAVAELGRQSGESESHDGVRRCSAKPITASKGAEYDRLGYGHADQGTAARFFYQAKASASDRLAYITCAAGCAHHESVAFVKDARDSARDPSREHPHGFCRACNGVRTHYGHPTVKPLDLAKYHARLLSLPPHTRPIALVPFCGTGIEARALLDVGFRVIAIDLDPRHCAMTEFRLTHKEPDHVTEERTAVTEAERGDWTKPIRVSEVAVKAPIPSARKEQLALFGAK